MREKKDRVTIRVTGEWRAMLEAAQTQQVEFEAMQEYTGKRAEASTMLLVGAAEFAGNVLRAGAAIAEISRNQKTLQN